MQRHDNGAGCDAGIEPKNKQAEIEMAFDEIQENLREQYRLIFSIRNFVYGENPSPRLPADENQPKPTVVNVLKQFTNDIAVNNSLLADVALALEGQLGNLNLK